MESLMNRFGGGFSVAIGLRGEGVLLLTNNGELEMELS